MSKKLIGLLFIISLLVITKSDNKITIGGEQLSEELINLLPEIQKTIQLGKNNIWNEIEKDQPYWNFPPWLGTMFLSEYFFELKALNITGDFKFKTKFDVQFFREKLIKQQQADGSWMQLIDLNRKEGSLDATIFNYWFLKQVGVSMDSETMQKARKFILDHGGIENAQVMTKYKLASFGVYEWTYLPYVPLMLFRKDFPFNYIYIKDYVAQWVYPHLTALAYLRYHKTVFSVSRVCLQELRTSRSNHCEQYKQKYPRLSGFSPRKQDSYVDNLLNEVIDLRGPRGAFGAYTISTLLNLMCFKDYSLRYGTNNTFTQYYDLKYEQSMDFIEQMYFNKRVPYEGSLDDGRYWDTILSVMGLLEAGQNQKKLHPTLEYLVENVQQNGGIGYGWQFQYAPDIDDTALLMLIYGRMKKSLPGEINFKGKTSSYQSQIDRTYKWLRSTQNQDGGFPAFDKDKNDDQYRIIKLIFKLTKIDKSAEIFDPSCPDIVGHMLEAMGDCQLYDQQIIEKSVQYLYNSRKDGMWSGRWGINYVYAVGAVYPGLARIGYDLDTPWVVNITKRLQQVQQKDGGFGEDSQSYNIDKYLQGATTVTMTAWGLLAYLEASYTNVPNLQKDIIQATKYLLRNFKQNNNRFFDRSVIGAGHRGLLNLQYPVYAYSFPLTALSRLRKIIKGEKSRYINRTITHKINKKISQINRQTDL